MKYSNYRFYRIFYTILIKISINRLLITYQSYLLALSGGLKRDYRVESVFNKKLVKDFKTQSRIAVSGWELSHNAAGRAITLVQLYNYSGYDVDTIGCIIDSKKRKNEIWPPLEELSDSIKFFSINYDDIGSLLPKAIEFVIRNPYGIIHLSKPRITNVVLGFLYKFFWGSAVLLDIDDEELAFSNEGQPFNKDEIKQLALHKAKNLPTVVRDSLWTQVAVGLIDCFSVRTVSNPALSKRYGGIIIPHVRNEKVFYPSSETRCKSREKYNLPDDAIIVLFFGSPKKHKGLLETAHAIATLDNPTIIYMIVGDFKDQSLKEELVSVQGVNYVFLPDQPYSSASDIVAIGDICILLQDQFDTVSQFQLPAKLIDALASGLKVFLQQTIATEYLAMNDYISMVTPETLTQELNSYIDSYNVDQEKVRQANQYKYFIDNFSMHAYSRVSKSLVNMSEPICVSQENQYEFLSDIANYNLPQFLDYCILRMKC